MRTMFPAAVRKRFSLFKAIREGDAAVVESLLLADRGDLNDSVKVDALHSAIKRRDARIVAFLLQNGADPRCIKFGWNALDRAIATANHEVIELLLKCGVHVNCPGQKGTPLFQALLLGKTSLAEHLVGRGVNARLFESCSRPVLDQAAEQQLLRVTGVLLEHGADPNQTVMCGGNAFLVSFALANDRLTDLFLSHGAKVHAKDELGENALHHAARRSSFEVVEKLLRVYDFDVNEANILDQTPLFLAAQDRRMKKDVSLRIVRLLVEHGANVSLVALNQGFQLSLLHVAVLKKNYAMIEYLLQLVVDVSVLSSDSLSPLDLAIKNADESMVEYLIDNVPYFSAERKLRDQYIDRAIRNIYCNYKCSCMIKLLLEKGMPVGGEIPRSVRIEADTLEKRFAEAKRFQRQLNLMRKVKVCSSANVTYFEVLTKRGKQLLRCLISEQVQSELEAGHYKYIFMDFSNQLEQKYSLGMRELKAWKNFEAALCDVFKMILPMELTVMICEYLDLCDGNKFLGEETSL